MRACSRTRWIGAGPSPHGRADRERDGEDLGARIGARPDERAGVGARPSLPHELHDDGADGADGAGRPTGEHGRRDGVLDQIRDEGIQVGTDSTGHCGLHPFAVEEGPDSSCPAATDAASPVAVATRPSTRSGANLAWT